MAKGNIVLFEGEEYWIVGEAIMQNYMNTEETDLITVVAINKIETANSVGIQRVIWLPIEAIIPKLSAFDFTFSEWYKGVTNGS